MTGIERSPRYSWIVNQKTLMPTGYDEDEMHPALEEKKRFVLMNARELREWIERKRRAG